MKFQLLIAVLCIFFKCSLILGNHDFWMMSWQAFLITKRWQLLSTPFWEIEDQQRTWEKIDISKFQLLAKSIESVLENHFQGPEGHDIDCQWIVWVYTVWTVPDKDFSFLQGKQFALFMVGKAVDIVYLEFNKIS